MNMPFGAVSSFVADYRNIYFLSFVDLMILFNLLFLTICVSVLNPAFSCSALVNTVHMYDGIYPSLPIFADSFQIKC